MTKWEGLALAGVAYLVVKGRRRTAIKNAQLDALGLRDAPEPPPRPMPPSLVARIVDAPDGDHFHLMGPAGALIGVFDTVEKANEVGRSLGFLVVR